MSLTSGLLERDASSPCLPNTLGVSLESAGMSCMPQVGLAGPASVAFPVVASGEPVSVPDNLLKICKAKPVIFKGKYNATSVGAGGGRAQRTAQEAGSTQTSFQRGSKGVLSKL